MGMVMGGENER